MTRPTRPMNRPTRAEARTCLEKLRVKPGLIGQSKLCGDLRLGFWFDRDAKCFAASVEKSTGGDRQSMGLTEKDRETRSRSVWATNNTWRLTPAGVEKILASLESIEALTNEP